MSEEPDITEDQDDLDRVLAEYMLRVDRGEQVDREELIEAHPELADALRECLCQAAAISRFVTNRSDAMPDTSRIGPYEILSVLGEGSYGIVYLAKDVDLERPVAIKLAKQWHSQLGQQVQTFLEEARRVAQLRHPSIVNIFDVSRGDSAEWYLVMEYIDGPSLKAVFAEGRLSVKTLVELIADVAEAIDYAHNNGILHRDLKPANVLLNKSGQHPRIVDFGMALHEREQHFAPRHPAGTPYCMAPEQVRGETHRLDARTDVWSLGVMLYEGLTGKRPFCRENDSSLFKAILEDDPDPLSRHNSSVPNELQRICIKCLSKRMGDRYATAAELAMDLRRWRNEFASDHVNAGSATEYVEAPADVHGHTRIVPKGLRSFSAEDAGFFLELLPGPRGRDGLPESVNTWIDAIENRDHRPERAVLVLYGPTGSGKSSFVRAGLLPRLASSTATICADSAAGDLEQRVLRSLHHICPNLPARVNLVQACSLIRSGSVSQFDGKVLIVLDQFEQWLHRNNSCLSGNFAMAMRQCDGRRLQCLFVVRSDFWLGITRFLRELEVPLIEGDNSAHLDLFDIRHARRVLTAFGQSYGCLPPAGETLKSEHLEFLEHAAEQIATDGWVVPVRLALFAEMMKGQDWTADTLRKAGGEQGLRVAYLDQVFASPLAAPSHRRFRRQSEAVLRALLPEPGVELKGQCRTRLELKQASGLVEREDRFAELMNILDSQLRLITPTEDVEVHDASATGHGSSMRISTVQPSYQLTHDYLVSALREWLSREQQSTSSGRARLCLEERDRQWQRTQDPRYLPTLSEVVRIVTLTDRNLWSASQRSMIRKSVGRHFRQSLVWIFTVAILSIFLSALYFSARPPNPLLTFQNARLPANERIAAFGRLDLSSATTLGPVIYTLKRERQPDVLLCAVEGLHEYVQNMPVGSHGGGDSVRDLILSEIEELLGRDQIVKSPAEDGLRATLFSTYSSLVPAAEALQFAADSVERNRSLGKDVLIDYLKSFDTASLLQPGVDREQAEFAPDEAVETVTSLIRLIDILPPGEARSLAADLLARLPADQLLDLLMTSFAGKPYQHAERSAAIYVMAGSTADRRQFEARRLLDVIRDRLDRMVKEGDENVNFDDQLEYLLSSIRYVQPYTDQWDEQVFENLRLLLRRRGQFRESAIVDVTCAAYAEMYATASHIGQGNPDALQPLYEILSDDEEVIEYRCAAANALAKIGDPVVIANLAAIVESSSEPSRLRSDAIMGMANIGQRNPRSAEAREIAHTLAALFDTEKYESDDLLADVVHGIAAFGELDDFSHVLSVLNRTDHDLNLDVQDAVFSYLFRNPHNAAEITEQTLVAIVALPEEAKNALYPSPVQFLADIVRMRHFQSSESFQEGCCRLAEELAQLSARHDNPLVRRLASQNLAQLPFVEGMPRVDPDATLNVREEQLAHWQKRWTQIKDRLYLNVDLQFEVR